MNDWHEEVFREEGWFDVDEEPPLRPAALTPEAEKALAVVRASMAELAAQRGQGCCRTDRPCCQGECGR